MVIGGNPYGVISSLAASPYVHAVDDLRPPLLTRQGQTRRETGTQSQGSPTAAPAARERPVAVSAVRASRSNAVKATLARFTAAVMVLAALALTLGAGIRWGF